MKFTFKNTIVHALIAATFIACVSGPLEARTHWHHLSVHHMARRIHEPRTFTGVIPAPIGSYSAYAGAASSYAAVPHDPLVPLKQEVPPPVDPNEATSGSYGAMVNGSNSAGANY